MHTKAFPYIILLSLFWGTNIVASRFGIGEFNPYVFIALRLATATLTFALFLLITGKGLPRGKTLWGRSFISGILGVAIPMTTFILSLQYQSSGVASIYVTASPAIMVIAAVPTSKRPKVIVHCRVPMSDWYLHVPSLSSRGESSSSG